MTNDIADCETSYSQLAEVAWAYGGEGGRQEGCGGEGEDAGGGEALRDGMHALGVYCWEAVEKQHCGANCY